MVDASTHHLDVVLVREARRGSPAAIEQFVQRMRCVPRILTAKNAKLGRPFSADEVRDLVQETYTHLWARIDSFAGMGSLEAFAYRFCCHVMMNAIERRRRLRTTTGSADFDTTTASPSEVSLPERQALHDALSQLPPEEALVIQLKHLEGLTFTSIAARTRTSANSAKTRYYRALRKLKQLLSPLFRGEAS